MPLIAWLLACTGAPDLDPAEPDLDRDGVLADQDCDDLDPLVRPGAQERCDGLDQDCDMQVDEGLQQSWYLDADGDGFGDPDQETQDCAEPADHVQDATDCDDSDASVNPDATESWYDGVDQDCAGDDDHDADGDRWSVDEDCDDTDPDVNPGEAEVCNNGVDDDCNGSLDQCRIEGELELPDEALAELSGPEAGDPLQCLGRDLSGDGLPDLLLGVEGGTLYAAEAPVEGTVLAEYDFASIEGLAPLALSCGEDAVWVGDGSGQVHRLGLPLEGAVTEGGLLNGSGGFGDSLASLGDVDGDGVGELWVGSAPAFRQKATAWLFASTATEGDSDDALLGITAQYAGEPLRVGAVGDLDGDGLDELGLARVSDELISGGEAAWIFTEPRTSTTGAADMTIEGWLGGGVRLAGGDLDGDGVHELLLLQHGDEGALLGLHALVEGTVQADEASAQWAPTAGQPSSLAVGDVDGDGADDVLVGDPCAEGEAADDCAAPGAAWLFYGPLSGTLSADATLSSPGGDGAVGHSVQLADHDLDGYGDLLISEGRDADNPRAWLILGLGQ